MSCRPPTRFWFQACLAMLLLHMFSITLTAFGLSCPTFYVGASVFGFSTGMWTMASLVSYIAYRCMLSEWYVERNRLSHLR
jgi:hypothetical protein